MNGGAEASVNRRRRHQTASANGVKIANGAMAKPSSTLCYDASFMKWTVADAVHVATHHWMPCLFALGLLFFMAVEYTLLMVPPSSPPFDLGFIATRSLHALLESSPNLNTLFAGLNTVRRLHSLQIWISRSERVRVFFFFLFQISLWVIAESNLFEGNANGLVSKSDIFTAFFRF